MRAPPNQPLGRLNSMVEVEAAQEVLICFAIATVLREDESGNDFEDFGRSQERAVVELLGGHHALAGRIRRLDQLPLARRRDGHLFQGSGGDARRPGYSWG